MKETFTRKEVAAITGFTDRRILFYSENYILPGFHKSVGRGTPREYTRKDVFFLLIVKELDDLGMSLARIRPILMGLFVKTMDYQNAPEIAHLGEPSIWVNGTFTKEPRILAISLPQSPEEHHLGPGAQGYDSEVFVQFYDGSEKVKLLSDRPSKIVLNLNQIFAKAGV